MTLFKREDVERVLKTAHGVGNRALSKLDRIDPVEAIPIEWLEGRIKKDREGNAVDLMEAAYLEDTVKAWKKEQNNPKTTSGGCNADYCSI
jgi:hypothetical protein